MMDDWNCSEYYDGVIWEGIAEGDERKYILLHP